MSLQTLIKADLMAAMKSKDEDKRDILRVIMGEFGRHPEKEIPDADVIKIVKKLVKSEKEVLEQSRTEGVNRFIEVAQSYLPAMADEAQIKAWISANIDFTQFNNKMQAMRPIMQHFGANADGNLVKKVLGEL